MFSVSPFAKGFSILSAMPLLSKGHSLNKQKARKKRNVTKETSTPTAEIKNTNMPVVNLTSDDGEEEPVADDTTSVLPSPSSSSLSSVPTAKRRHFGWPKKKSSVWQLYSTNEAADVTCAPCDYVFTPSGHIRNAVIHLKNNHADTFTWVCERRKEFILDCYCSLYEEGEQTLRKKFGRKTAFLSQYCTGFPAWYRSMNTKCSIRCLTFLVFGKPVSFEQLCLS